MNPYYFPRSPSFLFGILTMYLTACTKEKGKVKALREDVAKIEDEKQKVISKYQKEIEDLKKFHSLDIVASQSNGIRYHSDSGYITLDYEEVPFISQDLGSSIVKIQPLLTYSYGTGTIALNPSEDVWKEEYKYTNNIYTSSTNVLDPIITRTEINVDFGMNSNNRTPNGW